RHRHPRSRWVPHRGVSRIPRRATVPSVIGMNALGLRRTTVGAATAIIPAALALLTLVACSSSSGRSNGSAATTPESSRPPATQSTGEASDAAATGRKTASPAGDKCPILGSAELDPIVGVHLTDHFRTTQQPAADSPMKGNVLCDFANSAEG